MNKHCDSVSIEVAYNLMEKLGIETKSQFAELCGVSLRQFRNWELKGRMPSYRLAILKEVIITDAKSKFDRVLNTLLEI